MNIPNGSKPPLLIDTPRPGVCRILLNRPEARNAIDGSVRSALDKALREAEEALHIRALILGGAGGFFCAGGDLPTMVNLSADAASCRMREAHAIVRRLWHFPKPIVIALEGSAVGAGAALALLGDYIVMGAQSRLAFPFLKLGLVPDWGLSVSLPLRTGPNAAARLFVDCATVDAERSLALNLADEIVPVSDVMTQALLRAEEHARLALAAFGRLKSMRRAMTDITAALQAEHDAQISCLTGAEFAEGFAAFREERAPDYLRLVQTPKGRDSAS